MVWTACPFKPKKRQGGKITNQTNIFHGNQYKQPHHTSNTVHHNTSQFLIHQGIFPQNLNTLLNGGYNSSKIVSNTINTCVMKMYDILHAYYSFYLTLFHLH